MNVLTPEQEAHNFLIDLQRRFNEAELKRRQQDAKIKGTVNVIGRSQIIGIYYVES